MPTRLSARVGGSLDWHPQSVFWPQMDLRWIRPLFNSGKCVLNCKRRPCRCSLKISSAPPLQGECNRCTILRWKLKISVRYLEIMHTLIKPETQQGKFHNFECSLANLRKIATTVKSHVVAELVASCHYTLLYRLSDGNRWSFLSTATNEFVHSMSMAICSQDIGSSGVLNTKLDVFRTYTEKIPPRFCSITVVKIMRRKQTWDVVSKHPQNSISWTTVEEPGWRRGIG